ncbi:MAG TPA: murein biosynthesis integral membrane protein MurJ [Anaeromyxobacteraceae bacterium]|nr:murein biosynthesis integral membrane protein MurJ [Anaeromyxobacteraceae bacterium]
MRMARAVWISVATFASRLLGLVRDQLFAAVVGANAFSDAFVAAFRIPNLLRDLFAEGALSSAFVPTFAQYRQDRGAEEAFRLANLVAGLVLAVVGGLSLAGILLAGPVVRLVAPGFTGDQSLLAADLTRIMMPFLLLVSLSASAMGMLNAQGRFTAPALAPALFNVGSIAVGIALWAAGAGPRAAVVGWSIGTLLGGLLQVLVQAPSLLATGYRFRPRLAGALREPGVRRIAGLMGAAVVGLSATQVNIVVNTIFASQESRAVTWLNFAFRLMQFPLGVFGVAIATVAGAGVARQAAARDLPAVRETLGQAMRLVAFLNVPSAAGLLVLASPIIAVIYQHGRFSADDTSGTAQALAFYAVGLYAYSGVKVLAPAFYALDEARIPVLGSILGMAANVGLNLALHPVLGYRGVALGTSLAAGANFAVLAVAWKTRHGGFGPSGIWRQLGRVGLATAALAAAAWGAHALLLPLAPPRGISRQALLAFVPILAGAGAYLLAARLMGVRELADLWGALRRRAARE